MDKSLLLIPSKRRLYRRSLYILLAHFYQIARVLGVEEEAREYLVAVEIEHGRHLLRGLRIFGTVDDLGEAPVVHHIRGSFPVFGFVFDEDRPAERPGFYLIARERAVKPLIIFNCIFSSRTRAAAYIYLAAEACPIALLEPQELVA